MGKDINGNDLHPDDLTIVRSNKMNNKYYVAYCGSVFPGHPNYKTCSSPRMIHDDVTHQDKCPNCGWTTEFPDDFIKRYKAVHNIK